MATVVSRYLAALGPIKMEAVSLNQVTTADTFTTLMQRPIFALASEFGTAASSTVQISAISGKTLTISNNTTGAGASNGVNVIVFGF